MFSKILIKLIDQAIVPALLLLSVRVISIVAISNYFDMPFNITSNGFVFTSVADYIYVNSYSTFSMVLVLTTGLLYILLKSFFFHDTHISPALTAKLFSLRLSVLIQNSFDLYSQGTVWISYGYLLTFVAGFMAMFGLLYAWVFYAALVLTILSTVLFILDIENELGNDTSSSYDTDNLDYLES